MPKLLILLTDGSQTKTADSANPALLAKAIRKAGIIFYVVGIGKGVLVDELQEIAGSRKKVFLASSFDYLISPAFVKTFSFNTCEEGTFHLSVFTSSFLL